MKNESTQGDCGYNAFLGKPAPPHPGPGRDLMLKTWRGLSKGQRAAVAALAAAPLDGEPIRLREDFGVPIDGEYQAGSPECHSIHPGLSHDYVIDR